ncbi:MAG TPA: hypothetical protein VF173_14125 [Thermoanaerobaculia bacterium]|nr:hypothetical protein [Thermoanaerobaculia bacterium]
MTRKSSRGSTNIAEGLLQAALGRELSSQKAWDYGWCLEEHRRSSEAALTHDETHSVVLTTGAVAALEAATIALLRQPAVVNLYDPEEFWSIVAGLIGTLPLDLDESGLKPLIDARLQRLLSPPPATVLFPVSHIAMPSGCLQIGPLKIGAAKSVWASLPESVQKDIAEKTSLADIWWGEALEGSPNDLILCAYTTRSQLGRAYHDAAEDFDDLVSLALMFEANLDELELYSLRGDVYRPGVRGIKTDRHALGEAVARDSKLGRELAATILTTGIFGPSTSLHWLGESTFPLERLLAVNAIRERATFLLSTSTSVTRRLRLAARWHAKAHWSTEIDDAVLALGISFDVLLKEKGNSPGRVHAERFAFLVPDPEERRRRYKRFQGEYYAARSAVAHGGRSSATDAAFVRRMAADVRAIFYRLVDHVQTRAIQTDAEYDTLFDELKWGEAGMVTDV